MMWNLPRDGFEELVHQLEPPKNIDVEELWRLTGGNPRALIEIAQLGWDVEKWIGYLVDRRVASAIHGIDILKLSKLVNDPDADFEIARVLEDRGLMIELSHVLTIGSAPREDPELGIGREWAWQIPAYREVIKRILSEKLR